MRTRGEGSEQEQWYSICSMHHTYNDACGLCQTGRWVNVIEAREDSELFKRDPAAWRKKANHPDAPGRKFLESIFPGLRNK